MSLRNLKYIREIQMEKQKTIHEFKKNARDIVRVELGQFKGYEVINIRVFYQSDNNEGKWLPTRNGITMLADLIPELKEAIDKANTEWKKRLN